MQDKSMAETAVIGCINAFLTAITSRMPDVALPQLERAVKICNQAGLNDLLKAEVYRARAYCYYLLGDHQQCQWDLQVAHKLNAAIPPDHSALMVYINGGRVDLPVSEDTSREEVSNPDVIPMPPLLSPWAPLPPLPNITPQQQQYLWYCRGCGFEFYSDNNCNEGFTGYLDQNGYYVRRYFGAVCPRCCSDETIRQNR